MTRKIIYADELLKVIGNMCLPHLDKAAAHMYEALIGAINKAPDATPQGDLIDRGDVINALESIELSAWQRNNYGEYWCERKDIFRAIKNLPAAQSSGAEGDKPNGTTLEFIRAWQDAITESKRQVTFEDLQFARLMHRIAADIDELKKGKA